MHSTAVADPQLQGPCLAAPTRKQHSSIPYLPLAPRAKQQHDAQQHQHQQQQQIHKHRKQYRSAVAAQSALLDIDWPGISRMLLPPVLSAAAFQKASDNLAKRAAIDEVCRAFQVQDKEELQVSQFCWSWWWVSCLVCLYQAGVRGGGGTSAFG